MRQTDYLRTSTGFKIEILFSRAIDEVVLYEGWMV